jgi:hypothetical protein
MEAARRSARVARRACDAGRCAVPAGVRSAAQRARLTHLRALQPPWRAPSAFAPPSTPSPSATCCNVRHKPCRRHATGGTRHATHGMQRHAARGVHGAGGAQSTSWRARRRSPGLVVAAVVQELARVCSPPECLVAMLCASEVARGVALGCVHRYVRHARLCAALCAEMHGAPKQNVRIAVAHTLSAAFHTLTAVAHNVFAGYPYLTAATHTRLERSAVQRHAG